MYRNEQEAGIAIRDSGLKREEIYVTTKYSGMDGLDIHTSIRNSLKNVSVPPLGHFVVLHGHLTFGCTAGFDICGPLSDPRPSGSNTRYTDCMEGIRED
jgi:hypothetical protein